jgi:tRNA (cmo5U34)-methyltransferase
LIKSKQEKKDECLNKIDDNIYAKNANWKFDKSVVENFDEHIRRSVPLYDEGHKLILELSDYFIKDDSKVYELGSSTGSLIYRLAKKNSFRDGAKFIGIDIEKDMIEYAKSRYTLKNLKFEAKDIITYDYQSSDLFISYYTVQFIHPKFRQELINTIYKKLNWGGAFIMYEKVRANDARFQDIMSGLYLDFKLSNGFTSEEIINKARSLKGVLEPFSTKANIDMLKRAGFVDIISVQKYINFEGFLAIK